MKVVNRSLGTAVHGLSVCVWLAPCRLALRKMLMVLAWTHLSKCQRLLLKVFFSFQALSPAYAGLELQLQLMPGVHVARSAQLSLLIRQLSFHTPSSGGQHMAPHAACQQSKSMPQAHRPSWKQTPQAGCEQGTLAPPNWREVAPAHHLPATGHSVAASGPGGRGIAWHAPCGLIIKLLCAT